MGCLNSNENFLHWFGNIHLSGPCNRSCYFCIGQNMMALDPYNNLNTWPLLNIDKFVAECIERNITDINVTGSNTDPLLYKHLPELVRYIRSHIPHARLGLRTNGVLALQNMELWNLFDKASISVTSFNHDFYAATMGQGTPPPFQSIMRKSFYADIKANVVLCPETVESGDIFSTLNHLANLGVCRTNIREPYGQPHIGDPLAAGEEKEYKRIHNMPVYKWMGMDVTYWDVHYVEVESVNLYANGIISTTYPVSKGHCPNTGKVLSQDNFLNSGRIVPQWIYNK